jgi:predicted RNase H-like HicB family nuclease
MHSETQLYPAVFSYAEDGVTVAFPDVPGAITCGQTEAEAVEMAEDVLGEMLYGLTERGLPLPTPTMAGKIPTAPGDIVVFISTNLAVVRLRHKDRAVKKTLSIPQWLNQAAEAKGVNFSQVLQMALKELLGVQ